MMTDSNVSTVPSLAPRTFEEAREFATFISKTRFVPETYRGKPDEILACLQYGSEIGLSAMQSLQSIEVINGRPSMFGDVMLALVQASGKLEYIKESSTEDTATCEVKRKGDPQPHTVKWSVADTVRAELANKDNHKKYPARMRQMRARGYALRDKFADILKGLMSREEAIDITPVSPEPSQTRDELTADEQPHAKIQDLQSEQNQKGTTADARPAAAASAPAAIEVSIQDLPAEQSVEQPEIGGTPTAGGEALDDDEIAMALTLFDGCKAPLSKRLNAIREAFQRHGSLPFTKVENLTKAQLDLFAEALRNV